MFHFASGVLQGCPASAFLFNLALDPFLCKFQEVLGPRNAGIIRACADDLGAALKHLKYVVYLQPIFYSAKVFAGLTLHPEKCVIVPLLPFCNRLKREIAWWHKR